MKKLLLIILLGILFSAFTFSIVLAKPGTTNIEGTIVDVNEAARTITVETAEGDTFEIQFPEGYTFNYTAAEDVDTLIHIKGELQEDGTVLAEWAKPVDEEEGEGEGEGDKTDSAYCSGEKETQHPAALFLSHSFGKEVEEIMGYFCDGFGFGQISLALQTEKIAGVDYGTLLANRAEGQGWGEIWKELGYHGKPKDEAKKVPPGQEKDKDKDKDKGPDADDDPKDKDKLKEKKPKKDKKDKKEK